MDKGLLMVFTGNGKGKTSAAMGVALRAVGQGFKVLMIQFIKGSWHYGELDSAPLLGGAFEIRPMGRGFVKVGAEKPDPEDAPSNLAIIGRYVLTPKIFEKLEQTSRGSGGEIQLTDAIEALMQEQDVYGYAFDGVRYDAGTTMGWLKASVELALQREDIGGQFRRYLQTLDLS